MLACLNFKHLCSRKCFSPAGVWVSCSSAPPDQTPPYSISAAHPAPPLWQQHPEVHSSPSASHPDRTRSPSSPCSDWSPAGMPVTPSSSKGERYTNCILQYWEKHTVLTFSCLILAWTSHSEKCSMLVSCRSISVNQTRTPSLAVSNSSRWLMKCYETKHSQMSLQINNYH